MKKPSVWLFFDDNLHIPASTIFSKSKTCRLPRCTIFPRYLWRDQLEGKTFCVRVKRRGKHDFSSIDVERYVGGGLNQHIESGRVKLTNPDVTVHLEVEDDRLLLIKGRYEGIGGFPIGTQEDVLSLISGGFDSGVSSYMLMRRGCRVHYCFFNLGGAAHEIGVRQVAHYLWNRFGSSHRVRFVAINFEPVVGNSRENRRTTVRWALSSNV